MLLMFVPVPRLQDHSKMLRSTVTNDPLGDDLIVEMWSGAMFQPMSE